MDSTDLIKMRDDLAKEIADNHNELCVIGSEIDSDDVKEHNYTYLIQSTKDMEQEISDMFDIIKLEQDVGSREWEYWLYFIHEDDFTDHIMDSDILEGVIPNYIVIDWEATAENLRHDYSSVEYQGETYYYMDWLWIHY